MEIIQSYSVHKNNKLYLYDHYNSSHTTLFHSLKGRFFKHKKYWVFPSSVLEPQPVVVKEQPVVVEEQPVVEKEQPVVVKEQQTKPFITFSPQVRESYIYSPPPFYFDFVQPYTTLLQKIDLKT